MKQVTLIAAYWANQNKGLTLNSINIMKPTITVNQYPIGWEWLDRVPLEDFNWLIEIFSTMTDNTDTYDFVGYTDIRILANEIKPC